MFFVGLGFNPQISLTLHKPVEQPLPDEGQAFLDIFNPKHIAGNITALAKGFVGLISGGAKVQDQPVSPDTDYNERDPLFHYYEHETVLFSTEHMTEAQKQLLKAKAFEALLKYPAPGADGQPIVNGEIADIGFGSRVKHFVDADNLRVTNVTLDGHVFDEGEVERLIVEENGQIKIKSIGQGVNESAWQKWLNLSTANDGVPHLVDGFAQLDQKILTEVRQYWG